MFSENERTDVFRKPTENCISQSGGSFRAIDMKTFPQIVAILNMLKAINFGEKLHLNPLLLLLH